jgi:oxygen-independent coproporphyrinogen-3 oxidase
LLVNLDLMYGLPDQSLESWLGSLRCAIAQRPDSISTYCTFVDRGTKMWRDVHAGRVALPGHELIQTQHIAAQLALSEAGYSELPNDFYSTETPPAAGYRQDTLPSDGNSVGLGAGAYGYYPGVQYFNEFSFGRYQAKVRNGELPLWRATGLSAREELARDIMFSLKNAPELRLELFERKHGVSPLESHSALFAELAEFDLIAIAADAVRLTAKGRLVVEEIACLFQTARANTPASAAERRLVDKHHFAPTYVASGAGA